MVFSTLAEAEIIHGRACIKDITTRMASIADHGGQPCNPTHNLNLSITERTSSVVHALSTDDDMNGHVSCFHVNDVKSTFIEIRILPRSCPIPVRAKTANANGRHIPPR